MDTDDLSDIQKNLQATIDAGNQYLKSTLFHFSIRWFFTISLFVILWNRFVWLKWLLIILIPLGSYNLYQIYHQKKLLKNKVQEIELIIKEIQSEQKK